MRRMIRKLHSIGGEVIKEFVFGILGIAGGIIAFPFVIVALVLATIAMVFVGCLSVVAYLVLLMVTLFVPTSAMAWLLTENVSKEGD